MQLGPLELVVFQVTSFCNLNCDYCYLPDRKSRSHASAETLKQTLDFIERSGIAVTPFTISWHAGEPLAGDLEFYRSASTHIQSFQERTGVKVQQALQTNATLIDEEWCAHLLEHDIKVGVSVDGPAWLHDKHRTSWSGRGSHASALRGMKRLSGAGIDFTIIAVLTADSLEHPAAIMDFMATTGAKTVGFNLEEIDGSNTNSSLQGGEDIETRLREFVRVVDAGGDGWPPVREIEGIKAFLRAGVFFGEDAGSRQEVGAFKILNVEASGRFTTFSPELMGTRGHGYEDFFVGHVAHSIAAEIGFEPKFRRMLTEIDAGVAACRSTCGFFPICGGGNPVNKICEHGSFMVTETMHCRLRYKVFADEILSAIIAKSS